MTSSELRVAIASLKAENVGWKSLWYRLQNFVDASTKLCMPRKVRDLFSPNLARSRICGLECWMSSKFRNLRMTILFISVMSASQIKPLACLGVREPIIFAFNLYIIVVGRGANTSLVSWYSSGFQTVKNLSLKVIIHFQALRNADRMGICK